MKRVRFLSILAGLLSTVVITGQSPQSFNYQAVLRDNTGSAITSRSVSLRTERRCPETFLPFHGGMISII